MKQIKTYFKSCNMTTIFSNGATLSDYTIDIQSSRDKSLSVSKQNAVITEGVSFNHHALVDSESKEIFKPLDNDCNWIIATHNGYVITSTPVFYEAGIDAKLCRFTIKKSIIEKEEDKDFIIRDVSYSELIDFIETN